MSAIVFKASPPPRSPIGMSDPDTDCEDHGPHPTDCDSRCESPLDCSDPEDSDDALQRARESQDPDPPFRLRILDEANRMDPRYTADDQAWLVRPRPAASLLLRNILRPQSPICPTLTADHLHEMLEALESQEGNYMLESLTGTHRACMPAVYPWVVSFTNAGRRTNWLPSLPDGGDRMTFRDFIRYPWGDKYTKLGWFSVPQSWVTKKAEGWDVAPWHCWVVCLAISEDTKRFGIVIWDNDPVEVEEGTRVRLAGLKALQREFLDEYKRRRVTSKLDVYYSLDSRLRDQNMCLSYSWQRLIGWVKMGNRPWEGAADIRVQGKFVKLDW